MIGHQLPGQGMFVRFRGMFPGVSRLNGKKRTNNLGIHKEGASRRQDWRAAQTPRERAGEAWIRSEGGRNCRL